MVGTVELFFGLRRHPAIEWSVTRLFPMEFFVKELALCLFSILESGQIHVPLIHEIFIRHIFVEDCLRDQIIILKLLAGIVNPRPSRFLSFVLVFLWNIQLSQHFPCVLFDSIESSVPLPLIIDFFHLIFPVFKLFIVSILISCLW